MPRHVRRQSFRFGRLDADHRWPGLIDVLSLGRLHTGFSHLSLIHEHLSFAFACVSFAYDRVYVDHLHLTASCQEFAFFCRRSM